jgi:hypothetical protein
MIQRTPLLAMRSSISVKPGALVHRIDTAHRPRFGEGPDCRALAPTLAVLEVRK